MDDALLLKHVWIWKPLNFQTYLKPDLKRCRASVPERSGFGSHQCSRKVVVQRAGYGFCAQHDPVVRRAKQQERDAAWQRQHQAENDMRARQARERALQRDALDAIRKIAAGHNDARGLAQQVLIDHGEIPT